MDYISLLKKIEIYKTKYNVSVIGETYFKRKIFAVERILSENFFTAIFVSSIHARENISTDVVCKMIDDGLFDSIENFNISFILMANPDGVELCEKGLESVEESERERLFKLNHENFDFKLWKANALGVDLNNNFDAKFGTNVGSINPSFSGYAGAFAESENETKAIVSYLKKISPFFVINYHTKGEEIYFNFFQDEDVLKRDKLIAERFSKSTGYIIKNPEKTSSGGLKDYVVEKLKLPSLTIELGNDNLSHPIKKEHLFDIFMRNKSIAKDLEFAYNVFIEFEENLWHTKKSL